MRLTIDARLQASLEQLARERIDRLDPRLSVAILVLDNATGEVRAQVGSPDYWDKGRAGAIDMTLAVRSPGSALKPFIYALAFESGLAHPETLLDDRPSRYGSYQPENFDLAFQGTVTARKALQLSLNVPAVELLNELGPARLLARLRETEIAIATAEGSSAWPRRWPGRSRHHTHRSDAALCRPGAGRGDAGLSCAMRMTSSAPARAVARSLILSRPGTSSTSCVALRHRTTRLAGRIAFKTGTSYGYRDAWAVGYDRQFTIGVWVGRPDGTAVPGLVGRLVAAPILFDAYGRLGANRKPLPMPPFVLQATTATLPPPLRHVRNDVPKTIASTIQAPLRIAFPLDGSRVDLGLSHPDEEKGSLALKASGGVPPNEHGALNFNDLNTRDVEGAKAFYGAVFGWDAPRRRRRLDVGAARLRRLPRGAPPRDARADGAMGAPERFEDVVASLVRIGDDQPDTAPHWGVTFGVDDADAIAQQAVELGGRVLVPPFDAPWIRATVISDPQGAVFTATKFVPENKDLASSAGAADRRLSARAARARVTRGLHLAARCVTLR